MTVVDVITRTRWQGCGGDALVSEGQNSLGIVQVVHIQKVARAFEVRRGARLLALVAKTSGKGTVYGTGIGRICELALMWLDRAGVFPTTADERRIELHWPSPLPENDLETLQEAETKLRIGVAKDVVLKE